MMQEDKELLFKYLINELPYGIWFQSYHSESGIEGKGSFNFFVDVDTEDATCVIKSICNNTNNKPYLRSLYSMTEDEKKNLRTSTGARAYINGRFSHISFPSTDEFGEDNICFEYDWIEVFDWLNAHHFDYRGLISKGLALEASEDMYNIK